MRKKIEKSWHLSLSSFVCSPAFFLSHFRASHFRCTFFFRSFWKCWYCYIHKHVHLSLESDFAHASTRHSWSHITFLLVFHASCALVDTTHLSVTLGWARILKKSRSSLTMYQHAIFFVPPRSKHSIPHSPASIFSTVLISDIFTGLLINALTIPPRSCAPCSYIQPYYASAAFFFDGSNSSDVHILCTLHFKHSFW